MFLYIMIAAGHRCFDAFHVFYIGWPTAESSTMSSVSYWDDFNQRNRVTGQLSQKILQNKSSVMLNFLKILGLTHIFSNTILQSEEWETGLW